MNGLELYSAGILPYYTYDDTIYFLLGRDNDDKWSDFGGRCESKDRLDHSLTACREFWEETAGSIYDHENIKRILKYKKCPYIISKTGSGHSYYMYLLKINYYKDIREKFISTRQFLININSDKKYTEKNDIRCVSLDTIKHSIEDKGFISLRNVFKNTIRNHMEEILKIINEKNKLIKK